MYTFNPVATGIALLGAAVLLFGLAGPSAMLDNPFFHHGLGCLIAGVVLLIGSEKVEE
ncbi:MAG: hypothetical protein GWN58_19630 [Anaerolineae bacterium]|nr:hypothetical protein [Anaerolineae bacterium]